MKTFSTEDKRKDNLFEAWIEHLTDIHTQFEGCELPDSYEGLVHIKKITENYMNVELDDGRKIRGIPITKKIFDYSLQDDTLYMILGRMDSKWWPFEITSIASFVNKITGEFHYSINPLIHAELKQKALRSSLH